MIVLIPISRFRIDYQVASGRPYSQFEYFVLRAIRGGVGDLAGLRDVFQVHPRLIIEALVTLTQAGWLAIGGDTGHDFTLTTAGEQAVISQEQPRTRVVRNETTWVVMERVTGGLIPNSEVRFMPGRDLHDIMPHCLKLEEQIRDNKLDESQVQFLLPIARTEWLHQVRSIDMRARHTHWIPLNVELGEGRIDNLPDRWISRLSNIIWERSRIWARDAGEEDTRRSIRTLRHRQHSAGSDTGGDDSPALPPGSWSVHIEKNDFLWTVEDHVSHLKHVLTEAQSSVFIASAFLSSQCLDAVRPELISALQRRVTIDLLWGYGEGLSSRESPVEWIKKFAYEVKRDGLEGSIRFNANPSGSHAKILLWDSQNGWEACIGSFNWFSYDRQSHTADSDAYGYSDLTVCLRYPPTVAAIIRSAVALWLGAPSSRLQSTPDRWHRTASRIEADFRRTTAPKSATANGIARLVLDFDHESLLRTWLSLSRKRIAITSHKIGVAAQTRLPAAHIQQHAPDFQYIVVYGDNRVDEQLVDDLDSTIIRGGGELRHRRGIHAKILVGDSLTCIGSYNFLSADPFGTATRAREVSIVIESSEISDLVFNRVIGASVE